MTEVKRERICRNGHAVIEGTTGHFDKRKNVLVCKPCRRVSQKNCREILKRRMERRQVLLDQQTGAE